MLSHCWLPSAHVFGDLGVGEAGFLAGFQWLVRQRAFAFFSFPALKLLARGGPACELGNHVFMCGRMSCHLFGSLVGEQQNVSSR
jgi:hypothetical protein